MERLLKEDENRYGSKEDENFRPLVGNQEVLGRDYEIIDDRFFEPYEYKYESSLSKQ